MKLIYFKATWCEPCKAMLKNVIEPLKKKYDIEVVDCEEQYEFAGNMNVTSTPTIIMVDDENKEIARATGYFSKERVEDFINVNISN